MKVSITKDSKRVVTLDEADEAMGIIVQMKEDEYSAADYIKMAANVWLRESEWHDAVSEVLKASAEISKNARAWNAFSKASGQLDVWLTGIVETWDGFLKIECYLTDVWNIGADGFNEQFPSLVYARYYARQR